jgi:hypothetical protein
MLLAFVAGGGTVLLTTHILEVAERLAQRIAIIARGRLLAEGTLDELRASASLPGATLEDVFLRPRRHEGRHRQRMSGTLVRHILANDLRLFLRGQAKAKLAWATSAGGRLAFLAFSAPAGLGVDGLVRAPRLPTGWRRARLPDGPDVRLPDRHAAHARGALGPRRPPAAALEPRAGPRRRADAAARRAS